MAGRRALYLTLLIGAALLHFAYGQYVTHYILLFLLIAPILSVLISLPAALRARAELIGGADVCRGRKTRVRLRFDTFGMLPPEAWRAVIASENLFTGTVNTKEKVRVFGEKSLETEFSPDTSEIGCIRYRIKRAFVYDHLGLIPIPVRKSGSADITVLPDPEPPIPDPGLVEWSAMALKPKPQGFAEEHELRPYRGGDPLNLIHWKLSAKYDGVIVREPQEGIRKPIILVLDTPILYLEHRSVLEQLRYINDQLLENRIPYSVSYGKEQVHITCENEYEDFIKGVLAKPMQTEKMSAMLKITEDELVYRVRPGKGVVI